MSRCLRVVAISIGLLAGALLLEGRGAPPTDDRRLPAPTTQPRKVRVTPRLKAIQDLFQAQLVTWTDERHIKLTYFLRNEHAKALADFDPSLSPENPNLRLATPSDIRPTGVIISREGSFLHRARWKRVRVDVTFSTYAPTGKKDHVAAVITWDDGKRGVACNLGEALFPLKDLKPSGDPEPHRFPVAAAKKRQLFGLEYQDGVVAARQRLRRTRIDTRKQKEWLEGIASPRVGVVWRGEFQGYLDQVAIEGELDPAWLKEQLPDLPDPKR